MYLERWGYINNWEFGHKGILAIIKKLEQTGIELIEIGFIKGDVYNPDQTLFPDVNTIKQVLSHKESNITYVGMLDMICKEACVAAKAKGITVSCDLNYRSKLWSQDAAKAAMSELCSYVNICIANEEDAKNVFGIEADNTNVYEGKIDKAGYKDVAEEMKKRFAFKYIAFTLRTSHSSTSNDWTGMLYDSKQFYYAKEYHINNIIDRVGSGDSFGAGLIYGFRKGYDCQKAIEFAVASSALKHSIEGDFNRVSVAEVERCMHGETSGRIMR